MEGTVLTARRTAAASALASRYLSRPDSEHLLIVGTGAVAAELAAAHGAVRPLRRVTVWGRRRAEAERLAAQIAAAGMPAQPSSDLAESVAAADIISCATMSTTPLLRGAWLQAGQHVDLIGGYNQTMREADDEAVRRARVFVDTYTGALAEPGDIVQPIEAGVLRREDLCGDLYELTQGQRPGRQSEKEITLFKSVGSAVEDLAAAELAWRRLQ
jgi:ornithine cyclodeaminase